MHCNCVSANIYDCEASKQQLFFSAQIFAENTLGLFNLTMMMFDDIIFEVNSLKKMPFGLNQCLWNTNARCWFSKNVFQNDYLYFHIKLMLWLYYELIHLLFHVQNYTDIVDFKKYAKCKSATFQCSFKQNPNEMHKVIHIIVWFFFGSC